MKIVESDVCTNFRLSAKALEGDFSGQCDRFDSITARLSDHPKNDAADAMGILEAASVSWTQWSVVYSPDDWMISRQIMPSARIMTTSIIWSRRTSDGVNKRQKRRGWAAILALLFHSSIFFLK